MPTYPPPEIFKAYDVRGLYGEQITPELAERIGRAFARVISDLAGKAPGEVTVGLGRDKRMVENLRDRRVIRRAEDLGVDKALATRDLLAARSVKDLVRASGGLYDPPKRFRNW